MALTKTPIELSSTPSIVDGGNATAITIDSSENVMVGKTAFDDGATTGFTHYSGGGDSATFSTRSSNPPLNLNRLNSDGEILRIRKDGTAVGSIGVINGNNFTVGGAVASHAGFQFGTENVTPMVAGSEANGGADLGASNLRWRNLYLSGGAYLGGTAAANKLEDYEEGTWTPTLNSGSFSSHVATYTKVGSLVQLTLDATVGTGGASFVVVPFTCANTTGMAVYTSAQDFATGRTQFNGVIASTALYFRVTGDNIIYAAQTLTAGATIHASFTYRTNS